MSAVKIGYFFLMFCLTASHFLIQMQIAQSTFHAKLKEVAFKATNEFSNLKEIFSMFRQHHHFTPHASLLLFIFIYIFLYHVTF